MEGLIQDLRFGARAIAKKPAFTIVAIMTLALGIGANTAIFSVVNAVLLRPLPFEDPDRLVWMWGRFSQGNRASVSPPDFLDYRAQNTSFERFSAMRFNFFNLTGEGEPERLSGANVTADFFDTLGVKPIQGRVFLADEDSGGRNQVAVISEGLWRRRFGSDPNIVGRALALDGVSHTVVGIVSMSFTLPQQAELWVPYSFDHPEMKVRRFHFLRPIARLKSGVSLEQAQSEMDQIAAGLEKQYPESNTTWGLRLVSLQEQIVGNVRPVMLVLLGTVAFVLLIACANVANLLLARASTRQKEIAVRAALGASRLRLVRQLITESLMLALAGGLLGFLLALWGVRLLTALIPPSIPRATEIGLDARVLGFTLVVSLITGILFGLVPALHTSKPDLNESLKEGSKGSAGAANNRSRNTLVVVEVALALVLLVSAGLLIQSFRRLQLVEPGFDSKNLLTMLLILPESKYPEPEHAERFFDQALQRVRSLPGVEEVGFGTHLPFGGGGGDTYFTIEGRPFQNPNEKVTAYNPRIDHNYLRAMGMALVKGRNFTEQETREEPRVTIINETFVRKFFPDDDPIGKRLIIDVGKPLVCEIVGVVRDVKQYSLEVESYETMYLPSIRGGGGSLVIRTTGDPMAIAASVESEIHAVDKDQPVANVRTMEQLLNRSVAEPRFRTLLLASFAAVAMILASVGIYGVISYQVSERTREIGIRMALGADSGAVLKLVLVHGLKLVGAGTALGLASAFALTRVLSNLLFGVQATDPMIFAGVSLLLVIVAMLACFMPARRATKIYPVEALRYE
ncbi:MAG TPA: ABC transporter permease [Blastocatellia bacterium]|jgi:putative ABC transport system permease protein